MIWNIRSDGGGAKTGGSRQFRLSWADGHAVVKRKGAKAQHGKPQPKNMNRRKQRKQRAENFAENAEFSGIAVQRRREFFPSLRLCDLATLR
jgi:hypothetical protein